MKNRIFAAFSSIIMASALIITALAQGREAQQPPVLKVAPDIEVIVVAFDHNGQPLNGKSLVNQTRSRVQFTIRNTRSTPTGNFTYKMVVSDSESGQKLYDPPATQMSLHGNETKVFPIVELTHGWKKFAISARILADIGNLVKESNEQNNKYEVKFTGTNVY